MFSRRVIRFLGAFVVLSVSFAAPAGAQRQNLDSSAVRIWAAVLRTHDARSADTTAIDNALRSTVAPLRAAAVRVVGLNRMSARYAKLRDMLRTERDSAAASDAAFALGLASDSASCGVLRDALARPSTAVAAAWALGDLADRCGTFAASFTRARSTSIRAALLRGAIKWKEFPDSVVTDAFARATAPGVRWSALFALARAKRPSGAPFALPASHDAAPLIREVATRLMTADVQPPTMAAACVARLDSLLADPAPHVRVAAVRALATWKSLALDPLQRAWSRESDANVRITMAQSVGSVAADTSALWAAWWSADSTHMIRRSLIASAKQAGAAAALSTIAGDSLAQTAYTGSYGPRTAPDSSAAAGLQSELEYQRIVREMVAPTLAGRPPALVVATSRGLIRIVLDGVRAPMTSDHLSRLARNGYFRDVRFHRVVPAFVVQGGDPSGSGGGGPGFKIRDELNRSPYVRSAVGMALSGPDTGGSQFFLTLALHPHLDGHYTVFGHVSDGATLMDLLVQGDAIVNVTTEPR